MVELKTLTEFHLVLALFLRLNVIAGLIRIVRGPAAADRMMAAQLFPGGELYS